LNEEDRILVQRILDFVESEQAFQLYTEIQVALREEYVSRILSDTYKKEESLIEVADLYVPQVLKLFYRKSKLLKKNEKGRIATVDISDQVKCGNRFVKLD
jgi:hypothetical protein